ncbi:MAG: type II toxin-antitoxin system RelE/ParE family toxin [Bacteroidota bacterium]|nr:type II toxin-antitoxin system RelE/ParE family toxin [Bacteroidota bacterium]
MELTIRWKRKAVRQLADAIKYIEEDSLVNAETFEKEILKKLAGLVLQPERYQPDKFKTNNDGSFRPFEIHSYRISYRYTSNQIRIIRIRHTKMNPQNY